MNITYIQRDEVPRSRPIARLVKRFQRYLYSADQDGFFEHALQSLSGRQHKVTFRYLHNDTVSLPKHTDVVIVNLKCRPFRDVSEHKAFLRNFLNDRQDIVKCLFINAAQASYMFADDVLDNFDVIFKREPYKDRERYPISDKNKAKIVPTMIHCPFVHAPRAHRLAALFNFFRTTQQPCHSEKEIYEVGFSGVDASTHSIRRDAWQAVVEAGLVTIGGLQPNPNSTTALANELRGPRLQGKAYRNSLCQTKINLALDGIGEYTFRHQELFFLGKFVLSSATIRESELPLPLEDGKHYVAFTDTTDMLEKIRYYLQHEEERQRIAKAGQELFAQYYDPVAHGQVIVEAIENASGR